MIKINLLGDEEQTPINSILTLVGYSASVVFTLIFLLICQWFIASSIVDVKGRLQITEVQLNALRQKTKEVDGLKKTKDELEGITLAIAVLRRAQQGPVRLLDDINASIPERIWITSIDSKVDKMKITGLAIEDSEIAGMIQQMRQSSLILESELTDRRAVPLMQVNTFNSFSGEQTKRVVRGDKSQLSAVFGEIKREAETLGLNYSNSVPESSLKNSVATIGNPAEGAVTKLSFNDIKSSNNAGRSGRPTIYAWESLEQVRGLGFSANLKIRYDDSGINIDELAKSIVFNDESTPDPKKGKGKKKNTEE